MREGVRIYKANEDEANAAYIVAKRRNTLNGGGTNIPGGETASESGRLRQHFAACLAEIAVARAANLCWTGCGKGSHGIYDVGDRYEVRSITQRGRGLLIRPKDKQGLYVLVYVNVEERTCEILGWETPNGVRNRGRVLAEGTESPCHILPEQDLQPISMLLGGGY